MYMKKSYTISNYSIMVSINRFAPQLKQLIDGPDEFDYQDYLDYQDYQDYDDDSQQATQKFVKKDEETLGKCVPLSYVWWMLTVYIIIIMSNLFPSPTSLWPDLSDSYSQASSS